jgi:hypothetical protein
MHSGQYQSIVEFLLDRYTAVPMLVTGPSGIGKTQIPEQVAIKKGIPYVYFNATGMEPADLIGLPFKDQIKMKITEADPEDAEKTVEREVERVVMRHMPPVSLAQVEASPKGIICIDEITRVEQQVRHTIMQFLDRRILGEVQLPPGWLIILTANLQDADSQVDNLDAALVRRTMNYRLEFNLDTWVDWATTDYRSPIIDPKTHKAINSSLSARVISAVRRTAKVFNWKGGEDIISRPTGAGATICSELYHAGALDYFDAETSSIVFGSVVGPEVGQAVVKSLSDAKIQHLLDKAMRSEKFEAPHDQMIDLMDLFWERVSPSPKKYGDQILNFFNCLSQDMRAVLVKRIYPYFSKKDYINDKKFQELAKTWREWCTKMMYRLKGMKMTPGA